MNKDIESLIRDDTRILERTAPRPVRGCRQEPYPYNDHIVTLKETQEEYKKAQKSYEDKCAKVDEENARGAWEAEKRYLKECTVKS